MNSGLSIVASLAAVGFGIGSWRPGRSWNVLSYQWLFWLPMITTALAALGAATLVPESPVRTAARVPLLPATLLAAWLVSLLVGLCQGNDWGWGSARVLGLFAGALVLGAAWIVLETRVPVPLIDMRMMRRRGVWTANVVAGFVGFGVYASFGFLPQFLQTPPEAGYGFSATITESGHLLLPSAVASFLMGFMTARLVKALGTRVVVMSGTLASAAAFASIALWHDETWQLFAATSFQGVGSGLVFSSLAGAVIAAVPPEQTGVASGMNANIRTIGGSVGSAVMAGVVTARLGPTAVPVESGYVIGFSVLAAGMVLAAAAAAFMPNIHDQPTHDALEDAQNASLAMMPGGPALTDRDRDGAAGPRARHLGQ